VIAATTRIAAVIGDPVRHSLSPRLHNAAYRALGLDWVLVAFEIPEGGAPAAVDAARALGLLGYAVTMPHKTAIAELCDELSPDAAALRSVNTMTVLPDGRIAGDSTDGAGFVRSLADADVDPAGCSALVLGAGGAARAVARSLGVAGAHVAVAARNPAAASQAAALADGAAITWNDRAGSAATADIVVNATPLGMAPAPGESASGAPVGAEVLGPKQVVVDLVYHPIDTPLLRTAREQGATAVSGIGMLVHQAALQVERWSGQPAPLDAMFAALVTEVDGR